MNVYKLYVMLGYTAGIFFSLFKIMLLVVYNNLFEGMKFILFYRPYFMAKEKLLY